MIMQIRIKCKSLLLVQVTIRRQVACYVTECSLCDNTKDNFNSTRQLLLCYKYLDLSKTITGLIVPLE